MSDKSVSWNRESELVEAYISHNGDAIDTQNEYLFMGRAPDCIYMRDGKLHTVEAKLTNWKQAIKQARDHRLIADFAWILIPRPKPEWVKGTGIGLIDAGTFAVVVDAVQSDKVWPIPRQRINQRYFPNRELTCSYERSE